MKWPPAVIVDAQKLFSMAFLAISDQCAVFILEISSQNGRWRPFLKPDYRQNR